MLKNHIKIELKAPMVLFRESLSEENELDICKKYFETTRSRVDLKDRLVICRYSALPFFKELEYDLNIQGSKLLNNYREHSYVADFDYYFDIKDLTPKTYFENEILPEGKFIVKGKTNSRKFNWKSLMFAESREEAIKISCELNQDSMIQQQGTIVREYVPLETLEYGVTGVPMANEWRFFCLGKEILSYGFYWSIMDAPRPVIEDEAFLIVEKVLDRINGNINFVVVDVAKTQSGDWIVIELNDGMMSGLSENDPNVLYSRLKESLDS